MTAWLVANPTHRVGCICPACTNANRPPIERFWSHVAKGEGCWQWLGKPTANGYGQFSIKGKHISASRWIYQHLHDVQLPRTIDVCHTCDNRICVRPDHLFAGTRTDNMQDALRKGRHVAPMRDRTHCKRGHAFTVENTRVYGGKRHCRTCCRDWMRRKRAAA